MSSRRMIALARRPSDWAAKSRIPNAWSLVELRMLRPFVRDLAAGRLPNASEAARAYLDHIAGRPVPQRKFNLVQNRIIREARRMGLSWSGVNFSPAELRAIRRHVRGAVSGRYPSVLAAARACLSEFDRLAARRQSVGGKRYVAGFRRPLKALHDKMLREAHSLGRPRRPGPWTKAEEAVLRRYLKLLLSERYRNVHEAARACARELVALSRRAGRSGRGRAAAYHARSAAAIRDRLQGEVKRTALPRFRSRMSADEGKLIEAYAYAVDRGEYDNWKDAARACRDEMRESAAAVARGLGLRVPGLAGHRLHIIHTRILDFSRRMKLRGPRRILWTEPELRLCASWVRWYVRHRGGRTRRDLYTQAVAGLREDLEGIGSSRSFLACQHRLYKEWRRSRGLPA